MPTTNETEFELESRQVFALKSKIKKNSHTLQRNIIESISSVTSFTMSRVLAKNFSSNKEGKCYLYSREKEISGDWPQDDIDIGIGRQGS